jgi:hypothetical protein
MIRDKKGWDLQPGSWIHSAATPSLMRGGKYQLGEVVGGSTLVHLRRPVSLTEVCVEAYLRTRPVRFFPATARSSAYNDF